MRDGEERGGRREVRGSFLTLPSFASLCCRGQEGYIGIGYQTDDVLLLRLPGWEERSYG
jgi:hypothetical protein